MCSQRYLKHQVSLQQPVFKAQPEPTTLYALVSLEPQAVAGRMPLDIRLVLDRSYSMNQLAGDLTKLELLKQATVQLIQELQPGDRLMVVTFHDKHEVLIPATVIRDVKQKGKLCGKVQAIQPGGGTRMSTALNAATNEAPLSDHLTRLIFFTDGNICCANPEKQREKCFEMAKVAPFPWLILGTGIDYDEGFLATLAELNQGRYDHVSEVKTVQTLFESEIQVMGAVALTHTLLTIETANGFQLKQINRVVPEIKPISFQSLDYCAVELGELDRVRGQKLLLQLEGTMTQTGTLTVAKLGVSYHIPLKKLLNQTAHFQIEANFSSDPGLCQANQDVLHTVQLTGANQLYTQGLTALNQGQLAMAGKTLTTAAQLYTQMGDAELGHQIKTLCSAAEQGTLNANQEDLKRTLSTQMKYTVQRTLTQTQQTQGGTP